MKLFESDGSSDDNNEDISKIEIDKDFGRRYEHNKKREDLQRLQELKNKGIIVSDDSFETFSEEEEEDDDVVHSTQHDLQFFDALLRMKKQDPSLKLKDTKLFHSDEEIDSDNGDEEAGNKGNRDKKKKKEKKKPMYLKDVVAKQLIEAGPEFEVGTENRPKSYAEEQEELREELLDAAAQAEDSGDGGEFLKVKEKNEEEKDGVGQEGVDEDFRKKLDEYFGKEEELDENAAFLRDYFENRMWVDKGKEEEELGPDDLAGFSEDDEAMEKQEDYEREYNFRYEEDAGDQVLGHSRFVEGRVRKKPSARKLQRQKKKERMQLAELERQEELKHLKNLKREEIIEKRNKIKEIAGISGNAACAFDDSDLEDEFDPEKFNKKMKDMFGDDYYNAEDADPDFGRDVNEAYGDLEKLNFENEELLRLLPKDSDDFPSGKQFLAERERILKQKRGAETNDQEDEQGVEKKLGKELNDEEMEEIYKLDYEDTIGDLKTRFKYAKVKSNRFGLKPEELLLLDDRELNQYVSLKKIAPYRDHEWKVPNGKRYEQKERNRLLLEERMLNDQKAAKKKLKGKDKRPSSKMVSLEDGKAMSVETNGDGKDSSKKSNKRRCREEFKLSASRLYAYGKIPPKPKNKSKAKDKAKH